MDTLKFKVETTSFQGPLDLLLDLINKRKLLVNDVSLSKVTDDFLAYIEEREAQDTKFPLEESAEFLVVASTLMLIKSRSLLPGLPLSEEEEDSIEDLEHRLALYVEIKHLAVELRDRYGKVLIFEAKPSKKRVQVFLPDSETTPSKLHEALQALIRSLPQEPSNPKATVRKMVSLEEIIERLAQRISEVAKMNFKDFHTGAGAPASGAELTQERKIDIIVSFLAMLELVKRGIIAATQDAGGEIEMETAEAVHDTNIRIAHE